MDLKDARGCPLNLGDFLLEERGIYYEVLETDESFAKENMAKVRKRTKQAEHSYMRLAHVFKLTKQDLDKGQEELAALWRELYDIYCRPGRKADIQKRRSAAQSRFWRGKPPTPTQG